jgi:hypothetical protein
MTCRGYDQGALAQKPVWEGFETMLRIFAVTLLAIALSVGFAQAKHTRHVHKHTKATRHVQTNATPLKNAIPMCVEGQQVTATCACGTEASGRPLMCEQGNGAAPSHMPVPSETQPFGSELHQPCTAKRKAEFLEPSTSLKEAVRELKHVEQNRNPGAYLNKAYPTCSRPQSSIEVDAERTDLDIVFVDQIPDFALQLAVVLDARWRGVDLDCCCATMATNADLALTEMWAQDPLEHAIALRGQRDFT